jgi:hypothetical protein
MIDMGGPRRHILLRHRLQGFGGQKLLQHQTCGEDHKIAPIPVSQIFGIVERQAPAREGLCQSLMVNFGVQAGITKEKLHVALERPENRAESPRLVGEVVDTQDFSFKRRQHRSTSYSKLNTLRKRFVEESQAL